MVMHIIVKFFLTKPLFLLINMPDVLLPVCNIIYICCMKRFYVSHYRQVVVIIWIVIIFLFWLQRVHLSALPEATLFLVIFIPAILGAHLLSNVLLPKAIRERKMRLFSVQFIIGTLFVSLTWAFIFHLFKYLETLDCFSGWDLVDSDDSLLLDFLFAIPSVGVFNLGFCGLRFYYEHIKLQKVHLETQLQALQAQINPHFMFNILNHIHILMQTNVELASSLLIQYSDMLRYQLYRGKLEKVKLKEEIEFLQNYINIEKVRWGSKIDVSTTWIVTDGNMEIVPLLLISFVENAFKYASRILSGQGFVKIVFLQKGNSLCFEVENSRPDVMPGESSVDKPSGIGLKNTRQRLDLLYGTNYQLGIQETATTYYSKLEIWKI